MKNYIAVAVLAAFIGSAPLAMAAGAAGGSTGGGKAAHALSPKKRLKIQHKRIKQGVKNGTITKDQQQQLATEGKAINQERKADLAKDGGKLTKDDRHTLEKEEDARSKEIYQDKHPASTGGSSTSGTAGQ